MKILINATNISGGGGGQVTNSICSYLNCFKKHYFYVVLSNALDNTKNILSQYTNVKVISYNYPSKDIKSFFTCRNSFLDNLVKEYDIECVLTVFGPMKWKPKCKHVCGFAFSQLVIPESPYYKRMSLKELLKAKLQIALWKIIFKRSSENFYTENPFITDRLKKILIGKNIITVTNNYNQVFDDKSRWIYHKIPKCEGIKILNIGSAGPHKNLPISIDIAKILKTKYPKFKFTFIFTINRDVFPIIPKEFENCFVFLGKVDITECPSLYEQCDMEFQPTLLECFTATYPEAMKMRKPIVTTDLDFAKGLCDKAALYYKPLSAEDAAEKIYTLANDKQLYYQLIESGVQQLKKFDTSFERAKKIIEFCESV